MAAFVDVLLRGIGLSSQAIAVGGVLFGALVLWPVRLKTEEFRPLLGRSLTLITAGAVGLAVAQSLSLVVQLGALADGHGWPIREAFATTYFHAAIVRILAGAGLAVGCWVIQRQRGGARVGAVLIGFAVVVAAS